MKRWKKTISSLVKAPMRIDPGHGDLIGDAGQGIGVDLEAGLGLDDAGRIEDEGAEGDDGVLVLLLVAQGFLLPANYASAS